MALAADHVFGDCWGRVPMRKPRECFAVPIRSVLLWCRDWELGPPAPLATEECCCRQLQTDSTQTTPSEPALRFRLHRFIEAADRLVLERHRVLDTLNMLLRLRARLFFD